MMNKPIREDYYYLENYLVDIQKYIDYLEETNMAYFKTIEEIAYLRGVTTEIVERYYRKRIKK